MIKQFKKRLNLYFLFYPKTRKLSEFKEELLGVLMEKYEVMLTDGVPQALAFERCIDTVNDYKETIEHIASQKSEDMTVNQRILLLLSALVYITFVVATFFITSLIFNWNYTWLTFIAGIVGALIMFGLYLLKKAQKNSRFTLVRIAIPIIITLLTTAVYLSVSFALRDKWSTTWIAYIVACGVWYIVDICYRTHHNRKGFRMFDWLVLSFLATLIVYFIVSFVCNLWGVTWIVFVVYPFIASLGMLITKAIQYGKINKK